MDFWKMVMNDCSEEDLKLLKDDDYWDDLDVMSTQICCID